MISFHVVRLILELGVQLLEIEFVNCYREGDKILYVFAFDKEGESFYIIGVKSWGKHWQAINKLFEILLKNDHGYTKFSDKMFFVREGNHMITT